MNEKNILPCLWAVARVSGKDIPMPYNRNLEFAALPSEEDVVDAVLAML